MQIRRLESPACQILDQISKPSIVISKPSPLLLIPQRTPKPQALHSNSGVHRVPRVNKVNKLLYLVFGVIYRLGALSLSPIGNPNPSCPGLPEVLDGGLEVHLEGQADQMACSGCSVRLTWRLLSRCRTPDRDMWHVYIYVSRTTCTNMVP